MAPIRCCFDQTAVWHSDAARGPSTPSFDHLVGAGEQRRRNINPERLGSPEVDGKLELGWLHPSFLGPVAERQAEAACLLPECSRCAFHGSHNLLDWRLASRVRPQLPDVLL